MPTLTIQNSANLHLFGLFVNMIDTFLWTCSYIFEELFEANFIQSFCWDKDPGSDDMLPATLLKTQRFTTEKLRCDMCAMLPPHETTGCMHQLCMNDYAFWLVAFGNGIRMKQQESRVNWAQLAPECSTSGIEALSQFMRHLWWKKWKAEVSASQLLVLEHIGWINCCQCTCPWHLGIKKAFNCQLEHVEMVGRDFIFNLMHSQWFRFFLWFMVVPMFIILSLSF